MLGFVVCDTLSKYLSFVSIFCEVREAPCVSFDMCDAISEPLRLSCTRLPVQRSCGCPTRALHATVLQTEMLEFVQAKVQQFAFCLLSQRSVRCRSGRTASISSITCKTKPIIVVVVALRHHLPGSSSNRWRRQREEKAAPT